MKKQRTGFILFVLLATAISLILIKGNVIGFVTYLQGEESYLGSSVSKERVLITTPDLLSAIVGSEDYEDSRRKHPDFESAPETVLNSKTTKQELIAYNDFLFKLSTIKAKDEGRLKYQSVVEMTHLVHRSYKQNLISGRTIEGGVVGRNRSHPEDYVYQLVNSKMACGTVGEATVALLRELGFKSRLVIASANPDSIIANHILSEVYVPERNQWIMVDPMIDYTGTESIFELISNEDKASIISKRHGYNNIIYSSRTVVWFDKRSPFRRKLYYYTAQEDNHETVSAEIEKMN